MASSSKCLVACNIYISAGRKQHRNTLLSLLSNAQKKCYMLRNGSKNNEVNDQEKDKISKVIIVHAFADGPYNRSSFHIAGYSDFVVDVASSIAKEAMKALVRAKSEELNCSIKENTLHPYVGIVDHVSVMPLLHSFSGLATDSNVEVSLNIPGGKFIPSTPHGRAAYSIGESMKSLGGCDVHYYGSANPNNTPLAQVRREKTSFFNSGGIECLSEDNNSTLMYGAATVGAPPAFVENFNIRFHSGVPRRVAVELARTLRHSDGPRGKKSWSGLKGVEALTLPYSDDRWEVACNLLQTEVSDANTVKKVIKEWEGQFCSDASNSTVVESAYSVGTTRERCWEVLRGADEVFLEFHDRSVREEFSNYLNGTK